ncbi:lysin A, protease C39 domain [Gordonia phage Lozinak]|uniref:Lysin A, protease C39 domain n=2 Tax=Smoothievirus smoothie TaxID=1982561 RepID=A0A2D1GFQ1_9CAUD|nr:endolysin [Gordonia phage Smoothie]ANA86206.1 lysin A, protease C39 domain [Gordonia phage Smoothie]ATN90675.1 lysin A, protease C39 domain [Gordonia phage Lozinak]QKY79626.1 lysin A, protease C39 domain [Gordonia Phage Engineer]
MGAVIVPHTYHAQQKNYTCGPSTALVTLSTFGIKVTEAQMERECGTDINGTADVRQINSVLTRRTGRAYGAHYMQGNTPTKAQKDLFWQHAVGTLAHSRKAMPINIWAQGNTRPPGYPWGLTMHYVTAVGIDTDKRLIYVSDSARFGGIQHWWMSADLLCVNITPKGYGALTKPDVPAPPAAKGAFANFTDEQLRLVIAAAHQVGDPHIGSFE